MKLKNQTLVGNFLHFGNFSVFNPQLSATKRSFLNRLIKLILLFNAVKIVAISLGFWLVHLTQLRMYLIEVVLFEENYQRVFDVGLTIVQIGFLYCFSFWSNLNPNQLESFDFLFISTLKDLYRSYQQRYQLDKALTADFLTAYSIFFLFSSPTIVVYGVFIFVVIARCLYKSFYVVSLGYFLSLGLFFFAFTLASYLLLVVFVVPQFILVLVSTEFLILRARKIGRLVFSRFSKTKFTSNWRHVRFGKQKHAIAEVLHLMNDFFRQFRMINFVLDSSFSRILLGAFFVLFAIPYFLVFAENQFGMKLFLFTICFTFFLICFSISVYNDRLRRQVAIKAFDSKLFNGSTNCFSSFCRLSY